MSDCVRPCLALVPNACSIAAACLIESATPLLHSCLLLQWIGLVANAEFFCNDVQNEPLAEQLRERVR